MRVEDGRYWSYICANPDCCPPEGVRFDVHGQPGGRRDDRGRPGRLPGPGRAGGHAGPGHRRRGPGHGAGHHPGPGPRGQAGQPGRPRRPGPGDHGCWPRPGGGRCGTPSPATGQAGRSPRPIRWPGSRWPWPTCRSGTTRGRGWTPSTGTRTCGCGPTWSAGRGGPTWPRPPRCWRSPPGSAARGRWPTSPSTARWPRIPRYSLAHLLRDILDAGVPPSEARLPMTPEQVADSYAVTRGRAAAAGPAGSEAAGPGYIWGQTGIYRTVNFRGRWPARPGTCPDGAGAFILSPRPDLAWSETEGGVTQLGARSSSPPRGGPMPRRWPASSRPMRRFRPGSRIRLAKRTSNLFRFRDAGTGRPGWTCPRSAG